MKKKLVLLVFLLTFLVNCDAFEEKEVKVKLLFTGDLMLDRGVKRSVYKNFNGEYIKLFEDITNYLLSFDSVIVNLEGPISHRGNQIPKPYSFRFETNILKTLKEVNINIVNLANNHIFDWSYEAFIDTINLLEENGIGFFGIGNISNFSIPYIMVKSNKSIVIKIGFLGFSEFLKELKPSKKRPIGLSVIDEKILREIIPSVKSNLDFLVVCFHWGEEYKTNNNKFQERIAKLCIDLGADLIIGHHPHVIQNYEVYKDKFIFYSLGNFIFDQRFSKETMTAGLVEVEITKTLNSIQTTINFTNFYQDYKTLKLQASQTNPSNNHNLKTLSLTPTKY